MHKKHKILFNFDKVNSVNRIWLYLLILVGVIFLTYNSSLKNNFQQEWDDQWMLLENPILFYPSWDAIGRSFLTFYHSQYSPLNQLYYIGINSMAGFDSFAFHLGSVVIHMINAILVYFLVAGMVKIIKSDIRRAKVMSISLMIALIFAIHPLQVESVAWISASKVVLYTTFTLAGLLSYISYKNHKSYLYLGMAFLCYVASLMVKEQAIIFPLNLVLIDFLYRAYDKVHLGQSVWKEKVPFFILALGYWYWSAQNSVGVFEPEIFYPWYDRIVFGSYSLIVYLFRFFVPVNLSHFYAYPMLSGESIPLYYYGYLVMALLFVGYLFDLYRSKKWIPLFGLLFFVINILLVLHILPVPRGAVTADRYMYLSVVGLSGWTMWQCGHWYAQINSAKPMSRLMIKLVPVMVLAYLCGFMVQSNTISRKWKDSETLKKDVKTHLYYMTAQKPDGDRD